MSLREAAEMALEALQMRSDATAHKACEALRAALADDDLVRTAVCCYPHCLKAAEAEAPKAEPVAWYRPSEEGYDSAFRDHRTVMACTGGDWSEWIPLYTHPPEPVDEEVIGEYGWQGTSRHWWTGGA